MKKCKWQYLTVLTNFSKHRILIKRTCACYSDFNIFVVEELFSKVSRLLQFLGSGISKPRL